ncbi:hypothetical protein G9A89_023455 [Geosiphon pyriformis]|nr:hypothetical protein G9A89_023455 [Geosiphon pyriformis]
MDSGIEQCSKSHFFATLKTSTTITSFKSDKCSKIPNQEPELINAINHDPEDKFKKPFQNPDASVKNLIRSDFEKCSEKKIKGNESDDELTLVIGQNANEDDPMSWAPAKKRSILFTIALAGLIAPVSTTLYSLPRHNEAFSLPLIKPLGWATFSDTFGTRRKIYLISFSIFILVSIVCALSKNVWLLLSMRALQACGASAVHSIGAGTISDIYPKSERGKSFGLFYIGPLIGLIFGTLYSQNVLISTKFARQYKLSTDQKGWVMLPNGIGYMIGSVFGGRYSDYMLKKAGADSWPELRIKSSWIGATIFPIGMISFGWFVEKNAPLAVPLVCIYLVDAFPSHSASAIAANNFTRYMSAAIMTILAESIERNLGPGISFSLLSSFTIVSGLFLILVYINGRKWREQITKIVIIEIDEKEKNDSKRDQTI